MSNEATARIKINKLLEASGWRFFADAECPPNIELEPSVTLKTTDLDALGEDFEKTEKGFIDFLLLNEKGFPFIVLEAKAENKDPLVGKEQARKYAKSQNCRFVLLSNGNLHYFWDLERGNPYVITSFPTPSSVSGYQKSVPDCPSHLFHLWQKPWNFASPPDTLSGMHKIIEIFADRAALHTEILALRQQVVPPINSVRRRNPCLSG